MLYISFSRCDQKQKDPVSEDQPEVIVRRRDDGTISSRNQVNEAGKLHGIRVSYYGDGKTIYSKQTFAHGRKNGPANWYYTNGQIFKQSNFKDGKKQGLTRVFYKNGDLSAEYESLKGIVLPGLKEWDREGKLVTAYPHIHFEEKDFRASLNRVDLVVYCTKPGSGVKIFVLQKEGDLTSRVYLITEDDRATLQFYVARGESLDRKLEILAEIPTELGNVLTRIYTYHLRISR